jgi:hypothetical protein
MSRRPACLFSCLLVVAVASGCVIERKAECKAAEVCDQALEEPLGDFDVDDDVFGDAGTCWQTEDTALPCVKACSDFLVEQQQLAQLQNNPIIFDACGGVAVAN